MVTTILVGLLPLVTQKCCVSNTEEDVVQVLGPINGEGDDIITKFALVTINDITQNLFFFFWKDKFLF